MIEKCREAIEKGELERAIELGKQAVEMHPNSFDAYFCLGIAYRGMKNIEKSLENFKKAEELTDDKEKLITVYQYIGETLIKLGRLDDALSYFNKALTLAKYIDSNVTYILSKIAYIYFEKGDLEKSAEYYNDAIESGEKENVSEQLMLEIANNFSVVLAELGYYKEAVMLLKDLLNFGTVSDNLSLVCLTEMNLGAIYSKMGNKNAAKRYLVSGLNHAKRLGDKGLEATAYMYLGKILNKKSYLDKAEELFREMDGSMLPSFREH
jgi:tetratricopeptide (TPR) repeat protein